MAKTKISEFSSTPGNNTDIDDINIAEGCAPSGINNAIRELMAQLKDFQTGAVGDSFNGPVGTSTAAAGSFTTLTTSGAVTLNGGTANGVAFLNGSKVLTTGSALTFDGTNLGVGTSSPASKLDVIGAGAFRVDGAGSTTPLVLRNNNTASTQLVKLGFDSNGLIKASINAAVFGNDYMTFNVNNDAEQMRLTSTGLGIGTSSPTEKLTVVGAGRFNSSGEALTIGSNSLAANTAQYFRNTSGYGVLALTSAADQYLSGVVAGDFVIGSNGKSLRFGNAGAGTLQATLDSSGNLGLGVTPSAWLWPNGSAGALQLQSGAALSSYNASTYLSQNWYYNAGEKYIANGFATRYDQASGQHIWRTAPSGTAGNAISFTQAMTLTAGGNLLVGTTSGDARVKIQAPAGTTMLHATDGARGDFFIDFPSTQVTRLTAEYGADGILAFATGTSKTERARIDSSGNLLVGTTSTPGARLVVEKSNLVADFVNTFGTPSSSVTVRGINNVGTVTFQVFANGNVQNSNNSYGGISDAKLKENVTDATPKLDKLNQVRVVNYNLIGDEQKQIGVIAQELEQIFPGMIDESPDRDKEGNDLGTTTKSVKYSVFVPMLIKAIQEQQALITALTARITALESN